ncbi:MAG: hypothetical protein M1832_000950 [Thelocarpon impressellum]|nr:MAG: hypothetical protein M1832_000950 [Thelocarpon impressellum]
MEEEEEEEKEEKEETGEKEEKEQKEDKDDKDDKDDKHDKDDDRKVAKGTPRRWPSGGTTAPSAVSTTTLPPGPPRYAEQH